ncbi:MAG: PBECR2 nuclease fold domain-containing protein [Clostridia bacterium]
MQYIGKIDIKKLEKYKEKIITDEVILTDERKEHIRKRHPEDYEKYITYIPNIIERPDYILEDVNNDDTILLLKAINNREKVQVVIKLQTVIQEVNKCNSILTFWHIRDRNIKAQLEIINYFTKVNKNAII